MSSFVLKIIALIAMLCDHVGYTLFNHYTFLNLIGKLSFPIFAFQISEGYLHTKNLKNYIGRLLLFGIFSQIPFMLFLSTFTTNYFVLNIFFTLLLGLLCIVVFNKCNHQLWGWFSVIFIILVSQLIKCDYGWFGTTIIFLFYYFKKNPLLLNFSFIFATLIKYMHSYLVTTNIFHLYMFIATCLSLVFINLYNGKKGKNIKYLLYIFYPLHFIILYYLNMLLIYN